MALIRTPTTQTFIRVLPHVQLFCDAVERATGVKSFGTYVGHDPNASQAVDIHVPLRGELGDRVAQFAIQHGKRYGIRYIIWNHRIWNEEIGAFWRHMADRGDPTQNHEDHAHISFYADAPILHEDRDGENDGENEEELTVGQYEELNARLDDFNAKLDDLLLYGQHNRAVLDEFKNEVADALGQENWHQSGEAVNVIVSTLFNMLGDIKRAVVGSGGARGQGGQVDDQVEL